MSETKVTVTDNGPYILDFPVEIVNSGDETIRDSSKRVFLCRCGQSNNKPFCDGTHKKIGFESVVKPKSS
tara:strand:- start:190 stop:399 length:210 start_codon:yes stop_codon:yes gene_type:complete